MVTHRLATLSLCLTLAAAACSDPKREERRELLVPRDRKLELEQERERRRIFDDKGELLSSGERVAGVLLPKGLTLHRKIDEHTFYRSTKIPFEKLDRWFAPQLMSTTAERKDGIVKWGGAVPRDNLKAPRFDLHLTRLRGAPSSCEIYFRQTAPFKVEASPETPEAQLQRSRQYRD